MKSFIKFIYSEKATKFCKISNLLLSVCTVDKIKVEISQNFVAFSEYTNFTNVFYGRAIGCSHKGCSYIPTLYFATLHNMRALTQCESCMKKVHL